MEEKEILEALTSRLDVGYDVSYSKPGNETYFPTIKVRYAYAPICWVGISNGVVMVKAFGADRDYTPFMVDLADPDMSDRVAAEVSKLVHHVVRSIGHEDV